ncbi:MAG TPA: DUF4159 domain-containing protein [Candidatus Paceibacterota bacterium]|nr:DUF4159 domain-containing protein [Candidatus Paceibacterota bacterium]
MAIKNAVVAFALLTAAANAAPVDGPERHEFAFARLEYRGCNSGWDFQFPPWATDYPKADEQFILGVRRLANLDIYPRAHVVRIGDELHRYPFLYAVEVGNMCLTDIEAAQLARVLDGRGGFLMVDDFWGELQWDQFAGQMAKVLPGRPIRELPMSHPVFRSFYDVRETVQIPNIIQALAGGSTAECEGCEHRVYGIEDERGRLVVLILHNTDLGDAWEWAENPYFPLAMSNYAFKMGINAIVYAMTH